MKSSTRWNIKIGNGNKKVKSKLITIMDPHGDRVRAIIKDKTTTFLKAWRKELTKVARLQRKSEARERHAEMDSKQKGEGKEAAGENNCGERDQRDARRDDSDA